MTTGKDIFVKVGNPDEQTRIFRELCTSTNTVIGKTFSPDSEIVQLKAELLNKDELTLQILSIDSHLPDSGDLVLQISIGDEKYLFSSHYSKRGKSILISTQVKLYHLQRREDFRLRLPSAYRVSFEISKHNQIEQKMSFQVLDLSGGGCRVASKVSLAKLKIGDHLVGELNLPDRSAIAVHAEIRHEENPDGLLSHDLGLMFIGMSPPIKNRLAALVLDLYRQLYSRMT